MPLKLIVVQFGAYRARCLNNSAWQVKTLAARLANFSSSRQSMPRIAGTQLLSNTRYAVLGPHVLWPLEAKL